MKNTQDKLNQILSWMQNYKESSKCSGVVLGLSGGKDSTVVAMLAKKVFGDKVVAILMPNGEQKDIEDSIEIAKTLNLDHRIVNIGSIYRAINHTMLLEDCPIISDKAKTNIPPRIRMIVLYAIAQSLGYRVLGTGNKSESYIGWTTKYGDSGYDFNPIGDLTCTEVVEIGKLLAQDFNLDLKFIEKKPSDGLCGKNDEESFGFTYEQLDNYIEGNVENISPETIASIDHKHQISEHKRKMPEICKIAK